MPTHVHPVRVARVAVCDDNSDATRSVSFYIPVVENNRAITPIGRFAPDILKHPAPIAGLGRRVEIEDEGLARVDLYESVQVADLTWCLNGSVIRHFDDCVRRSLDLLKRVPPC